MGWVTVGLLGVGWEAVARAAEPWAARREEKAAREVWMAGA